MGEILKTRRENMEYLLIVMSILIFTVQTLSFKQFNQLFMKNLKSYFIFNTLYFSIVAIIFILTGIDFKNISPITLILGFIFALLFIVTILLYMNAMGRGPLTYTSLLFSFGLLVPIVVSAIIWKEKIRVNHAIGLILLFLTFYLGSSVNRAGEGRVNKKWIILSIAALLGNGTIMAVSKAHQMIMPGEEIGEFLVIAFGFAALISFVLFLSKGRVNKGELTHLKSKIFLLVVVLAGVSTAYGNRINLYLSGRMPAVVLFPAVNGGIVILSSIASFLFLKEKLSGKALAGLLPGLLALVFLSL